MEPHDQHAPGVLAGDGLDAVLSTVLARHPRSPIGIIDDDGRLRAAPAGFPIGDHPLLEGRTPVDLVVPADRVTVIGLWDQAHRDGVSRADVHLAGEPPIFVKMSIIDVVARWGVYVCVCDVMDPVPATAAAAAETERRRVAKMRKDEFAVMIDVDETTVHLLGWRPEEMIGRRSLDFIHPDDQDRAVNNWIEMLNDPMTSRPMRLRYRREDGSFIWFEITNYFVNSGTERYVLTDLVDVSDEMAAQEALQARGQLLELFAESVPLGIFNIDTDRRIVYANERLHQMVGAGRADTLAAQLERVTDDDQPKLDAALTAVLVEGQDRDIEVRVELDERTSRLCRLSFRALTDASGGVTGAIASVADVTESARMRVELEDRATFDALTGCNTRASVMDLLDHALRDADHGTSGTAVVFVDLDRFKPINDRLGHAAGDALLEIVAARLKRVVRGNDVVGRFGGDEFLVVCPRVMDVDEALKIAGRMADALHQPASLPAGMVDVRASVGVAWSREPALDADALVAQADTAMYESKRQGAGLPVLYGASLHPAMPKALEDERWLREALATDALEVHYQPIVDMSSGSTLGYEALLRAHRDGRLIVAGDFIELAEETGLIHEIGLVVREQTCRQAALSEDAGHSVKWAINASPLELAAPGYAAALEATINAHGIDARCIGVEVTEHSSLGDSSNARTTLYELAELGVGIALDDFGTGWSSLALLRTLPISLVKVDRSFTNDVINDVRTRRLVESVIEMARRIDVFVVIEGVETVEQRDLLIGMGATVGQGWLFSKARSASDLFGPRPLLTA